MFDTKRDVSEDDVSERMVKGMLPESASSIISVGMRGIQLPPEGRYIQRRGYRCQGTVHNLTHFKSRLLVESLPTEINGCHKERGVGPI